MAGCTVSILSVERQLNIGIDLIQTGFRFGSLDMTNGLKHQRNSRPISSVDLQRDENVEHGRKRVKRKIKALKLEEAGESRTVLVKQHVTTPEEFEDVADTANGLKELTISRDAGTSTDDYS